MQSFSYPRAVLFNNVTQKKVENPDSAGLMRDEVVDYNKRTASMGFGSMAGLNLKVIFLCKARDGEPCSSFNENTKAAT